MIGPDTGLARLRDEFLPAALAVQESPPPPLGRRLVWVLLALFSFALAWACFGRVDIVVSAPGRVVPSGQVKQVQAPAAGTVSEILVAEGDVVSAGQPLVRLDPTFADADQRRLLEQLNGNALETTWRRALEEWLSDGWDRSSPPRVMRRFAAADQAKLEALLRQHHGEISAQTTALRRELSANRAERMVVRAERERVGATLEVLRDRVAVYKKLLDQRYGARVQYLEILQQQIDLERSLPVMDARERQLQESAAAIIARMDGARSELRRRQLEELARLDSERSALEQELRKARQFSRRLVLTAPVAGTVQELVLHTIGGVVSPAQQLLRIVPLRTGLEVEALVKNRDVGFVEESQEAAVKVDAFNFTKYGLVPAIVANISHDAVEDPNQGWQFKMRLTLQRDTIDVEGKPVRLSPGMAVTAEVKTGQRRLIEYFLSPLLRYRQESVRER